MDPLAKLKKELGADSPLVALVEAGPDALEKASKDVIRKIPVYENKIDRRVIRKFSRFIEDSAEENGHKLEMVQPFLYDALYPDVMKEVRENTTLGLQYYQLMVRQMPDRFYFI